MCPSEPRDKELQRLRKQAAGASAEIERLTRSEVAAQERRQRQDTLVEQLRHEVEVDAEQVQRLREQLQQAELELDDLRAVRDALTPPTVPERPGLDLAASFLPASHRVSGDFYLVAEGPADSTVAVVGDVVGHGVQAAKRAAFVRTAFASTAPYSDNPCRLLDWANTALVERAGVSTDYVTAACVTYAPGDRVLRWAYAGHPPLLWLDTGDVLDSAKRAVPLGLEPALNCSPGSLRVDYGAGLLLYTDGLTEARRERKVFGVERVSECLRENRESAPREIVARLRDEATDFAGGHFGDDLCMLAIRVA